MANTNVPESWEDLVFEMDDEMIEDGEKEKEKENEEKENEKIHLQALVEESDNELSRLLFSGKGMNIIINTHEVITNNDFNNYVVNNASNYEAKKIQTKKIPSAHSIANNLKQQKKAADLLNEKEKTSRLAEIFGETSEDPYEVEYEKLNSK
jgi:ATP-dependent 26S proteasome regulatory subunit